MPIRLQARARIVGSFALLTACGAPALPAQPPRGTLQQIVVRGPSLERNLVGLSPDRSVAVYLPPSYATSTRRYPVLYLLHGIMDSYLTWIEPWSGTDDGFATIQSLMDEGIRRGALEEMILVIPDADKTCHYTDSPVKGGWGSFIARDLVAHVDRAYRTIAAPEGRGVLGHSMGGHGAIKLAMTHPGIFSAVYAMNPSMLGFGGDVSESNPELAAIARITSLPEVEQAGFYAQAVIGIGQCLSPYPAAPLLTSVPFAVDEGGTVRRTPAYERWQAGMPRYMVGAHARELRLLRGLRFDSAFEDEYSHIPVTSRDFSRVLDSLGVPHTFELYEGDHRNRLWGAEGRLFTVALPFFSRVLGFTPGARPTASAGSPPLPAASTTPAAPPPRAPPATTAPDPARVASAQAQLWRAAQTGDLRAALAALRGGADVNALDPATRTGRRPLNYAAENDLVAMIRWLVENGADVNRANLSGFTPLHHAAEQGAARAAEELLRLGADPTARLPSGSTPLNVARQRGKTAVVRILERATSPP